MKRGVLFVVAAVLVFVGCAEEEGGGAKFVTEGRQPAWGPNGLLCYVYDGALWTCGVDGADKKRLTPEGQWCQEPDWRSDGGAIVYHGAFKSGGDETMGLYIISNEGGEPRFLFKGDFETPAWSPDGKYVVAVSSEGLERYPGLYKINVETLEIDKLPSRATPSNPDWSPCGEWIVFAQVPNISEPVPEVGLWTVRAEGKDVRRLTATPGADGPCWSSAGRLIAYGETNGGVYTLDAKTGVVERVTAAKSYEPSWSPDGRSIAFTSAREGKKESIYVIYY